MNKKVNTTTIMSYINIHAKLTDICSDMLSHNRITWLCPYLQHNSESGTKSLRQFNSDEGNSNSIPIPMMAIPLNSVIHIDRTKLQLAKHWKAQPIVLPECQWCSVFCQCGLGQVVGYLDACLRRRVWPLTR